MSTSSARLARARPAARLTIVALLCAAVTIVSGGSPAAAATPVEDMGCRMVVFDNLWEHPYSRDGMVLKYRGCKVRKGWSKKTYRAMKDRQWRLNKHLAASECTVGDHHLSGVSRTHYKGTRVVVFKYRFDYVLSC
ncbi:MULTISPECIES: hypothetical protein [unclassified Nocardioides]|uniref:hypothetical protein n=1 Tax=unclassified Nocardioides TaxID=2615069 RepID=UPI0000570D7F|nr:MULTISPECIES: hypothetical protein [unclassified Nocardioides]ABL79297.1 hypothetical protein Noca_4711 [Nocardioides sp. JS614]